MADSKQTIGNVEVMVLHDAEVALALSRTSPAFQRRRGLRTSNGSRKGWSVPKMCAAILSVT